MSVISALIKETPENSLKLFPLCEGTMRNARLGEAQAGIKIVRRNINNLRYADDTTLMAESEEDLKSLLMKVKEESEKAGLKLNIQKTKIMASSPKTSWQTVGKKVEAVTDFIFFGSKMTVGSNCSHGIKTWEGKLFLRHISILEELNSTHPLTST